MGTILAVDIATRSGFAHDGPNAGIPITGTFRAPSPEGDSESGYVFGHTFHKYRRWLKELVEVVRPETLAFEAPLQIVQGNKSKVRTNQNTIRVLFGLAGITEELAEEFHLDTYEANVQQVKRHFAGHGHAEKEEMIARCRQLGWAAVDDNAADAAGLWSLVKSLKDPKWAPRATPLFARTGT